ncbi:MAG: DoxX family protein [Saprospiraceae bacterium]|nr:DoxX family protein [Saprospiraceae bacterium]
MKKGIDKMLPSLNIDLGILLLRLQTGLLLLTHGYPKLMNFNERMDRFSDPFGLGPTISLALVVFAEFFCSILLVIGWKVRWAVIPIIITMLTIIFYAHWDDPFGRKELPIMYLMSCLAIFFMGPGRYSLDGRKA